MKNRAHDFQIEHTYPDGQRVEGMFTTQRLSIRDRARIGMRRSQILGGMYCVRDDDGVPTGQGVDEDTENFAAMIAHLETSLIRSPEWFDLEHEEDFELVEKIYAQVMTHQNSFFRPGNRAQDGPDRAREGASGSEHQEAESRNDPTPVVDEEVSSALDA